MGTNKPILMARPQRGREMVSKQVAGQEKGKTTLMHEGYVGGTKYMVPDEDLEVMRELVDFKLGKKPMDRYVKDYDYTHLNKEPEEKFRKMSMRLQAMSEDSESTTSEKKEEEPEPPKDRKIRFEDEDENEEKAKEDEEEEETEEETEEEEEETEEEEEESTETSSAASVKTKENEVRENEQGETDSKKNQSLSSGTSTTTGKTQSFEAQPTFADVDRLRFLLSGHIRNNLRPIFIFHEYNGKSPFGRTPDFTSVKNEGDVDLYISGKFYLDNILEEVNKKLLSLDIKPEKIIIDDRSKVYEEQFYELLRVGKVNVDFHGKFIKQLDTKKYTPLLTFNVQYHPVKRKRTKNKNRKEKPAPVVYLAHPESQNIFQPNRDEEERVISENSVNKPKKSLKKNASQTPSFPKPGGDVNEYEPHLKKNPSRRPSTNESARRGRDAGDVGSEGGLVYNCDVNRRRSSKDKNFFRRLSQMFFSRH